MASSCRLHSHCYFFAAVITTGRGFPETADVCVREGGVSVKPFEFNSYVILVLL